MPEHAPAIDYRVVERDGPAGRLVLRSETGDRIQYLVLAGYRGPVLPETLTQAELVAQLGAGDTAVAWRLAGSEGNFEFQARAVDRMEECPELFAPLHRPFALRSTDRLAARALLGLLRLPGGARLMRLWHARRSR